MARHVLVAEDDVDILGLVRAVLEDSGFRVTSAVGPETLARVHSDRPDVILLDYQMPGMDGIAIAHELKMDPETHSIPIIAMTAAGRASIVCHEMDADGCLGKPFDIDRLVAVCERMSHTTH
jgi:two-component system alkaline phosphatase synthesis response regulator PhoP